MATLGYLRLPRFGFFLFGIGFIFIATNYESFVRVPWVLYATDMKQIFVCGSYFWLGSLFYIYKIPRFFTTSNLLAALFIWISLSRWPSLFVLAGFLVIPAMALAFGLSSSPLLKRMTHHDYSYGIYIYAFPVQQTWAYIQPNLPLPIYLLLVSFSTILLAAFSWNFIEKQALKLKPIAPTINRIY
jgi:peptidoglycan/LPS O-acetylase OafA/YrhL